MRQRTYMRSFLMVTAVTLLTAPPVSAEWFFDLYGGGAFVENNDVKLRKNSRFANNLGSADVRLRATLRDVKADDFATAGGRFGYWSEAFPYLGLGVDVFLVDLEVPRQRVRADANATVDVRVRHRTFHIDQGISLPVRIPSVQFPTAVVGAAPDVLFRYPLLTDAAFPKGRLQPYVSAAPAFLITDSDLDFELGVKVGAGLAWQLHKNVALFTEYRFTHFRPDIERGSFRVSQAGLSTRIRNPRVETDLNTHHILAGISFRF